jgi:hypothetical protein
MDGADQINIVTLITISICFAINSTPEIKRIGIIFLGGHLGFAYFVSGFAKLISPVWRNGLAAEGVLTTASYGSGLSQELVKKKQSPILFAGLRLPLNAYFLSPCYSLTRFMC